jgi:hypothetical protein
VTADKAARWDLFAEDEKAALLLGLTGAALLLADLADGGARNAREALLDTITGLHAELALHSEAPTLDIAAVIADRNGGDERPRPQPTDPREAGGTIVEHDPDATDPYALDSVTVDTSRAVLLDDLWVTAMLGVRDGEVGDRPNLAVQLGGRINQTADRASVLYLMDEDGAAAIIAELMALISRLGPEYRQRLLERLDEAPL